MTDFGVGFYTTTWRQQAEFWAQSLALSEYQGDQPAVVQFTVDRDALGDLEVLYFVRGTADADDFWVRVQT